MISTEQLEDVSRRWKIDRFTVMREYLQVLFLLNLYRQKKSEKIYFKGGTAIRLLFNSYRFSEDLDFTSEMGDIQKVKQMLIATHKDCGLEADGITINSWETKTNSLGARLRYATDIAPMPLTIHLEVSFREKPMSRVVTQVETILPISPYPMVTHMDKEELLAEKVRAFMTRQKGRDVFYIWFLLSKGVVLKNELIQKKMDYYKKKYSLEELKQRLRSFPLRDLKRDLGQFLPASHRQNIEKFPQMALEKL